MPLRHPPPEPVACDLSAIGVRCQPLLHASAQLADEGVEAVGEDPGPIIGGVPVDPRRAHYLSFADEAGARGAAEVVEAAGWDLQDVAEFLRQVDPSGSSSLSGTARLRAQKRYAMLGCSSKASPSSGQAATTTDGEASA